MKFSLSLALLTALFVASCSEEPPPQRAGRRAANYPPSRTEEYPPPQQPFNPNGPVQPTGTPQAEAAASPPPPAAPTKVAKGDYPYGIPVPGDKSISHRAVIIAALSNGVCTLGGFLPSEDCMRTVNAMRALGIRIEQPEPDTLIVHGKKRVLMPPKKEIDCGNSGTTMRLLAGLLAGQTFESRLVADAGLSRRPMDRVITPLRRMGANIVAEGPEQTPPLRIHGGSLRGIRYRLPIASAQIKGALLLAGLFAKGKTTVDEPTPTRNHTEVMLSYFLVRTAKNGDGSLTVFGDQVPESRDFTIPGDISDAAFWLVAAAARPRRHLLERKAGLNDPG